MSRQGLIRLSIRPAELPATALLARYRRADSYVDCFQCEFPAPVTQAKFIEAFYTTWLFGIERQLLGLIKRPSSDLQAQQLASGQIDTFAAWRVEARTDTQLLLADFSGQTRSWLMVEPIANSGAQTRLYFGSAVVPRAAPDGQAQLGFAFKALLGFHKLYSRALLAAARRRLSRML